MSVNSYDDSTSQSVSAPHSVTGCSSLPYAPKLAVTVTKDSADREVQLTTGITQAADEAPTGSMTLGFAGDAVGLNLGSVKALCLNVASGSCTPVGVATAMSSLYPTPLTPSLSIKIGVGKRGSKLTALTVELPSGLRFIEHGSVKHSKITGVAVSGAKVKSLELSGGHLVITLKHAARSLAVEMTTALQESSSLKAKLQTGKVKSLRLTVIATNTKSRRYGVHDTIKILS